jgi:hypothetical protein
MHGHFRRRSPALILRGLRSGARPNLGQIDPKTTGLKILVDSRRYRAT